MIGKYDYLIIGGGVAGVTAAETIREESPSSTIAIFSDEKYPLYSRVLLPAYLKKNLGRDKLFLRNIDEFNKNRIDLRLEEKVSYVDAKRREVWLSSNVTLGFNKLLLSSGGKVAPQDFPEDHYTYRLQTLEDADRLFRDLDKIRNPLVVGASFISLEFLEIFWLNKIVPKLIVRDSHFFNRILDEQGGELLRLNFERHGIILQFKDEVKEIKKKDASLLIYTQGLREIECDALALGVGIERNIDFLRGSSIELGIKGVKVNEFLETNYPMIFAAGDIAEFYDAVLGKYRIAGNWTNAFLQGRRAGLNMAGQRESFRNITGYSITNFGFQITALGDCGDGVETVVRIDTLRNQYERFFLQDGVLVGAALINRFQDKPHIAKLIDSKTFIESYRDQLRDFEFDIKNISVIE